MFLLDGPQRSRNITALMLTVTFLAFEVELFSQPGMYALSKLAAVTEYLLGIGNNFVASGWVHFCLASLIGALTFGIGRFPLEPGNAFVAALIATVLLMPAIFLEGGLSQSGIRDHCFRGLRCLRRGAHGCDKRPVHCPSSFVPSRLVRRIYRLPSYYYPERDQGGEHEEQGTFSRGGNGDLGNIAGPPSRPLEQFPVNVRGDQTLVGKGT